MTMSTSTLKKSLGDSTKYVLLYLFDYFRYHKYKELWTSVKAPGEKPHKELRWEVKAQMMYKEEPAPVSNTY